MIEELLPPSVVAVEVYGDDPEAEVLPAEAALVANAVERRRHEFATARTCARRALLDLGLAAGPILRGEYGEPIWPPGVVGSITHCDGYRAAAVARATDLLTIGIDAEPDAPLPAGVLDMVTDSAERDSLTALAGAEPGVCWDRLLFCAKEALYKAWYPVARRWLEFSEARISFDAAGGTFTARVAGQHLTGPERPFEAVEGRFLARAGIVATALAIPSGP